MSYPIQNDKSHTPPCADLIRLQESVRNLTIDVDVNTKDIRPLIELAAQIKLLMSLSIGGGALAVINLALFMLERFP